jgi:hypothetical protein
MTFPYSSQFCVFLIGDLDKRIDEVHKFYTAQYTNQKQISYEEAVKNSAKAINDIWGIRGTETKVYKALSRKWLSLNDSKLKEAILQDLGKNLVNRLIYEERRSKILIASLHSVAAAFVPRSREIESAFVDRSKILVASFTPLKDETKTRIGFAEQNKLKSTHEQPYIILPIQSATVNFWCPKEERDIEYFKKLEGIDLEIERSGAIITRILEANNEKMQHVHPIKSTQVETERFTEISITNYSPIPCSDTFCALDWALFDFKKQNPNLTV